MNWIKTASKFNYCGSPVVRKKATATTPLGDFNVFESVGGRTFIVHPFIRRVSGLPGFDDGTSEWFGPPRIAVSSFEQGINRCEEKWNQIKKAIAKS